MTDGPVRLLNLFRAREGREAEVEQLAQRLVAGGDENPLVRRAEVLRDQADPAHFVTMMDFDSESALEEYLKADWRVEALRELPNLVERGFQRFVLESVMTRVRV